MATIARGSRAQVMHGTAAKTTGGKTKGDFVKKDGRYKAKSRIAAFKSNPKLVAWNLAVREAKKILGIPKDEFAAPRKGTELHKTAMELYKKAA